MALWDIDLTTRVGARGAARTAATGAYLFAGATLLGALVFGQLLQPVGTTGRTSLNLLPLVQVVLAVFAGFRLQDGKGLILGSILFVVVALSMISSALGLAIGGVVLCGIVLVLLFQGLRGAYALHKGVGFEDDDIATFE